jgi:hypothetical protein
MRFVDEARVYVQAGAVADHDAANRHQPTPSTPFTCRIVHVGQASGGRAVRQAFARCEQGERIRTSGTRVTSASCNQERSQEPAQLARHPKDQRR